MSSHGVRLLFLFATLLITSMPYKTEKIALESPFLKRSSKLIECQKEMIKYWRERGASQREIAKRFKVSRRTIQFILDPAKLEENLKRREERGGSSVYYKREKHNEAIKELRKYKQKLFKK
jgi:IS30 family transposase